MSCFVFSAKVQLIVEGEWSSLFTLELAKLYRHTKLELVL